MQLHILFLWLRAILAWVLRFAARALRSVVGAKGAAPLPGDGSIDAAWLTRILVQRRVLEAQDTVKSVLMKPLDENRGLASSLFKLTVEYNLFGAPAPALPPPHLNFPSE